MRRISNGKRYNTETAEEIVNISFSNPGDFHYFYITKNNNFFLAGEGGPLSSYAKPGPRGQRHGSEGITALTPEEVLKYIEQNNLDIDHPAINEHLEDA